MASEQSSWRAGFTLFLLAIGAAGFCAAASAVIWVIQEAQRMYHQAERWFIAHQIPIVIGVALCVVAVVVYFIFREPPGPPSKRQAGERGD